MTTKQKEIRDMMPLITGKRVMVFGGELGQWYCTGKVIEFTGTYLVLQYVQIWNGRAETRKMISSGYIKKIELE